MRLIPGWVVGLRNGPARRGRQETGTGDVCGRVMNTWCKMSPHAWVVGSRMHVQRYVIMPMQYDDGLDGWDGREHIRSSGSYV